MDYWNETIQDDFYLIAANGWIEAAKPRPAMENKDKKLKEDVDLTIGKNKFKMDLLPPDLIEKKFFLQEIEELEKLLMEVETATRALEEFEEENNVESEEGEMSLLSEVTDDDGKVTKSKVKDRLKKLTSDDEAERLVLLKWMELYEKESQAKKKAKEAKEKLDNQILRKYDLLTEDEIKNLVIIDKWFKTLENEINEYIQKIATRLASRIKELKERYSRPLPEIEKEVEEYSKKVEEHLKKMGVVW
jgi:type I restriction enzyme M protein